MCQIIKVCRVNLLKDDDEGHRTIILETLTDCELTVFLKTESKDIILTANQNLALRMTSYNFEKFFFVEFSMMQ